MLAWSRYSYFLSFLLRIDTIRTKFRTGKHVFTIWRTKTKINEIKDRYLTEKYLRAQISQRH